MAIHINRTLNMKRIKAIGLDMDHTIIRYHIDNFERMTYQSMIRSLVKKKNYPKQLRNLQFDPQIIIQGLVIDTRLGNILKLSRFGKVKTSYHGTRLLDFKEQQDIYANRAIDLNDPYIISLDTFFSLAYGILFAQLIDLKWQGINLPTPEIITLDLQEILDQIHNDGTIKGEVERNIKKYILQTPEIPKVLERYKEFDKKILVITNSDFKYCKLLLDYAINPFLERYHDWGQLFDLIVTRASKPRFFTDRVDFLKVDPASGVMTNNYQPIKEGIYQGGSANQLQKDLGLEGDEILYLGDHIYGDVVSIKKRFNWRTALVVEPIAQEVQSLREASPMQNIIDQKMFIKKNLELELNQLYSKESSKSSKSKRSEREILYSKIDNIDRELSDLIKKYQSHFNPYWGELMRAGGEESFFAGQVEKYACIYMSGVADLLDHSPRTYFRPIRRLLAHEIGTR